MFSCPAWSTKLMVALTGQRSGNFWSMVSEISSLLHWLFCTCHHAFIQCTSFLFLTRSVTRPPFLPKNHQSWAQNALRIFWTWEVVWYSAFFLGLLAIFDETGSCVAAKIVQLVMAAVNKSWWESAAICSILRMICGLSSLRPLGKFSHVAWFFQNCAGLFKGKTLTGGGNPCNKNSSFAALRYILIVLEWRLIFFILMPSSTYWA